VRRAALAAAILVLAGCGGSSASKQPTADPKQTAEHVLDLIVHNHYTQAWDTLHPTDQAVASRAEYVGCESRSPVLTTPTSVKVVRVHDESVGLGDGKFLPSTAVELRLGFTGGFHVVQTVHLVASDGKWRWILPPAKYRAYKANVCPGGAGSTA
jgi:hypothetical protein